MPPRKSMPAPQATPQHAPVRRGQSSTPAVRRRAPLAGPSTSSRKRARHLDLRDVTGDTEETATGEEDKVDADDATGPVTTVVEPMDPEKQLEHWQDFAVDHYEMVEQLPLELHRNYRLLRELDDGVLVHTTKLQNAIREYISLRLDTIPEPVAIAPDPNNAPPLPSLTINEGPSATADTSEVVIDSILDLTTPIPDGQGGQIVPPLPVDETVMATKTDKTSNEPVLGDTCVEVEAGPVTDADAEGEIIGIQEPVEPRLKFPSVSPDRPEADVLPPQAIRQAAETSVTPALGQGAWKLLPEIARLAREMVKNGEEKVAVAQGAYNSIDRHIRALDSALSAQEASILLGLRPDTGPSTLVEDPNYGGGLGKEDDEEIVIGLGGGGPRRKGRTVRGGARGRGRGRGGSSRAVMSHAEALVADAPGGERVFVDVDPNEPRYCYCNRVSYGEMIGCDNDDCPIEWFHLDCAGMTSVPTGKWLCEPCKAVAGAQANGGSGNVVSRGGAARTRGRSSRGRGRGRSRR